MTRFSVILPVRNGWPYVKECVDSILSQTYPDFELLVLDNFSKDETVTWLSTVKDPRVRISRSDSDLSMADSWGRVKSIEKQEYMTLIGHDDLLDPGFLAAIKALIDRHPDAALYQTGARLINSEGRLIRNCQPVPERETAAGYLEARFTYKRDISGTGLVMRSAVYDRLGGIPPFEKLLFADDALWLSMMEGSWKAADPRALCSVRLHSKSESASTPSQWAAILTGLGQLHEFLGPYLAKNPDARAVSEALGPDFMLTYHRNIFIYALVDASIRGRRVEPTVKERIAASLARLAPGRAGALSGSSKVALIETLNAVPLRALVPPLWNAYWRLRSGS